MFKGFLEDMWDGIGEYVLHFYYPSQDKVSSGYICLTVDVQYFTIISYPRFDIYDPSSSWGRPCH